MPTPWRCSATRAGIRFEKRRRTTAREIVDDFKDTHLDYWVTGYGTGGTLKGVARVLAKEMPNTKIVVCEPADAAMLSSGEGQKRNADGSLPSITSL